MAEVYIRNCQKKSSPLKNLNLWCLIWPTIQLYEQTFEKKKNLIKKACHINKFPFL